MRGEIILTGLVNIILGIVEIFLGLRFFLKLLGANPQTGFVSWIYATSEPLLGPFRGMFPSPLIERGFVLEFSTLFAIFMYALAGWIIKEIIIFMVNPSRTKDERRVEERRRV